MLLGRERECRQLERVLGDARSGRSCALIVRGDAGMGKSALLQFAAAQGSAFKLTSAAGAESESELGFAALLAISRPLLPFLGALPETQRTALKAALALSSGVVADRFTAYAGALTLIAAAAEEQPVLILVDDLQWLDLPSREALLFVARRLGPDRVAVVMSTRRGEDEAVDLRGLGVLDVDGLDRASGIRLIRRRHRESDLAEPVAEQLVELTAGAPLALMEIPVLLTEAQRQGLEPLPDPLPVGDAIQRAFHRQIEALPATTQEALLVLAAEDHGSMDVVTRALATLDTDPDALEPAEQAGLIRLDQGSATFRHPLLRSAVYYGAPPAARRVAHLMLAAAFGHSDTEQRPWHLAAAAIEPDESVAAALEESAIDLQARAAFASAARAFERASELTPDPNRRASRLLHAAESAWRARESGRTRRLLDAAAPLISDRLLRADMLLLSGRFAYAHGPAQDAYEQLIAGGLAVAHEAPDKAASMLMQAAYACYGAAELERALDAAEQAFALAERAGGDTVLAATVTLSESLTLLGRTREATILLRAWKAAVEQSEGHALAHWANPNVGVAYLVIGDYGFAHYLLSMFHRAARATPEVLPMVLACVSQFEYRTGDWPAALAHASEGAHLGAGMGQTAATGWVLTNLTVVEAGLGRAEARRHAEQVEDIVRRSGFHSLRPYVLGAVGLLDLGAGQVAAAIRQLEPVDRLMREWGVGDPSVIQWMPDLVEAYVRAGRRRDAERLLETLASQAEDTDGDWARAVAARCEGLMAESFDQPFERALRLHATMPTPFDQARTQLCYGERLRRAGRRVDSREQLREALDTFERLGAEDWRKRAAAELGGSVEHRAPRDHAIERLSPQELQVALHVAEGATNRETAAALFVTTKTVEFHLRNVYAKLGIRSRTELAAVVARRRGPGPMGLEAPMTLSALGVLGASLLNSLPA